MTKAWQTLLFSVTVTISALTAGESERPAVQRIYTRCDWGLSVKGPHFWSGYDWKTSTSLLRGSFWVAQPSSGKPVLVTANHILKPYATLKDVKVITTDELASDSQTVVRKKEAVDNVNLILGSLNVSSNLTTLGYGIVRYGTVAGIPDLALLHTDERVIARQKAFKLAARLPHSGEKVIVWGLPGVEPLQNRKSAEVNMVQGTFFTINDPLDEGYSGGVVLNESGEAYGVVSTVTEKATTVYILNDEMLSRAEWLPYAAFVIK